MASAKELTRESAAKDKQHPWDAASAISHLCFWWSRPLFQRAAAPCLTREALHACPQADLSHSLGKRLARAWAEETAAGVEAGRRKPSLLRALFKVFWAQLLLSALLLALHLLGVTLLIPELLGTLVAHFDEEEPGAVSAGAAKAAAAAIVVCVFLQAVLLPHGLQAGLRAGVRARAALASLLYDKALRIGVGAGAGGNERRGKRGDGAPRPPPAAPQLVGLLAGSAARLSPAAQRLHFLWLGPLHAVAAAALLYRRAGAGALAGAAALLVIMVPLQGWLGRLAARLGKRAAPRANARLTLLGEVLDHARTIKMSAWEEAFEREVQRARLAEEKAQRPGQAVGCVFLSMLLFSIHLAHTVFLLCSALLGTPPKLQQVFVAMQHLYFLNIALNLHFPRAAAAASDAVVGLQQMQAFLLLEESGSGGGGGGGAGRGGAPKEGAVAPGPLVPGAVLLRCAEVRWAAAAVPVLRALRLRLAPGMLAVVTGPVGAGKSALLLALAGELRLEERGSVGDAPGGPVGGRVALAAQGAWAWSGACVRDNILVGRPFRPSKYQQVLRACCLTSDLRQLPGGDAAPVGDRGSCLSGGQRARLSLARCCYGDADVFLLDDPLSAVDARVSARLLRRCVLRLLHGRTRVVATHAPHALLPHAHVVIHVGAQTIRVEEGGAGHFQPAEGHEGTWKEEAESEREGEEEEQSEQRLQEAVSRRKRATWREASTVLSLQRDGAGGKDGVEGRGGEEGMGGAKGRGGAEERGGEEAQGGAVARGGGVAGAVLFLRAGRCPWLLLGAMLLLVASQAMRSLVDFWVGHWSEIARWAALVLGASPLAHALSLAAAVLLLAALSFARVYVLRGACVRSAHHLHADALRGLLRAPLAELSARPRGALLGPFASDLATLDERFPLALSWCLQIALVLGGITCVVVASQWQTAFTTAAFAAAAFATMRALCTTPTRYKHLAAACLEPQLSLVADTLEGLPTIRSLGRQRLFAAYFHRRQDEVTTALLAYDATNTVVNLIITLLVAVLVTANVGVFFLFREGSEAAALGLVFYLSLSVSAILPHLVENVVELLSDAGAAVSLHALAQLPPEEDAASAAREVPEGWPRNGSVAFEAVSLRWRGSDTPALRGLTFSIPHGQKVGVVGRTGAGKSSLLAALLRLQVPCAGVVRLAGTDCGALPLAALRRAVAVVPQEPSIFSGPLRLSLDPAGECSDAQLWDALRAVGLASAIFTPTTPSAPPAPGDPIASVATTDQENGMGVAGAVAKAGLSAWMSGSQGSAGERQLLCAARALLRPKAKLVVLDEASASLDTEADQLLHRAVGALGARRTLLAVAHRLQTVADADMLLVMDAGTVVEQGAPWELLQRGPSGVFASMVVEAGAAQADAVREQALQWWLVRSGPQRRLAEKATLESESAPLQDQDQDSSNL